MNRTSPDFDAATPDWMTSDIATRSKTVLLAFVIALIALAAFAPIASGALANGTVKSEGSKRTIQHLEGGVIEEILVRKGDSVSAGQVLLKIKNSETSAAIAVIQYELASLKITKSRIEASISGDSDHITFDQPTFDTPTPILDMIAREREIQKQSVTAFRSKLAALDQRELQYQYQIKGLRKKLEVGKSNKALVLSDLKAYETLFEKGLLRKPLLNESKREFSRITVDIAIWRTEISSLKAAIAQLKLERSELNSEYKLDASTRISELVSKKTQLEQRLVAANDAASRLTVRAPVSGQIVSLNFHTIGGVVRPGETIAEISPSQELLIVEAMIAPNDINTVRVGQTAKLTFPSLQVDQSAPLNGTLVSVSSDTVSLPNRPETYYVAEIRVPESEKEKLGLGNSLISGMPVEVSLEGQKQTFFEYLFQPITRSFGRAFR